MPGATKPSLGSRVYVKFQSNAWCDEAIFGQCWKPACNSPMHLVFDVNRAQKTETIQEIFHKECNTTCTYVPGGCTSLVQPIDVFQQAIQGYSEEAGSAAQAGEFGHIHQGEDQCKHKAYSVY